MKRSPLVIIFLVTVVDMVGFGIVIPILPYFAEAYGADGFIVGLLVAVFMIMQFIFTPIWGAISDRWGRRPVLIGCMFASIISYVIFAMAQSLLLMFVARIVGGIFAGKFSTIQAYIADITDDSNRSRGMGLFGAAFGIGFVLGPAIGGVLGVYGFSWPLLFAAGLSLVSFVGALFFLPETVSRSAELGRLGQMIAKKFSYGRILELFGRPVVNTIMLLALVFNFAFSMLYATFALYLERVFEYTTMETGYVFTIVGLVGAVVQGTLIGRMVKSLGEANLIKIGMLVVAVGMGLLSQSILLPTLAIAVVLIAAGSGICTPTLSGLLSRITGKGEQGTVLGYMQSVSSLGRIGGIVLGGFVYEAISIASPFWISAIILLLGAVAAISGLRTQTVTRALSGSAQS